LTQNPSGVAGTLTPVDAGYYVITATLTNSDGAAGKTEVVHIYQNLTTNAAFTFVAGDFTEQKEPVSINADNLSNLATLIAGESGGASPDDPIIVSLAISNGSLLSGTNGGGTDPLDVLFNAIPGGVYVAYDLSGCTSIPDIDWNTMNARANKDKLVSIILPDTLTTIGESAFDSCSGLTSVTIGNNVTSIGESAFAGSGLTSVIIPDSVTSIDDMAFGACSALETVTIGNSVTSIGDMAFYNCNALETVTIPGSVTSIGESAFAMSGLTSVIIPNSVTSIGNGAFSDCVALETVTIPNSVTSIGDSAFAGTGLTSVTIPNSVTSIGDGAFYDCNALETVTIGNGVTTIGDMAFYDCGALETVYVLRETPATLGGPDVFSNTHASLSIYVPASKVADYQAASWWSTYALIIAAGTP
jgi:hypothetical protein